MQVGIRDSTYSADERGWPLQSGVRIFSIEGFEEMGVEAVIREARRIAGDAPTCIRFDIDAFDPVFVPGTGTPEFAGLMTREVNRMLRGLRNLNLLGADVVEVSPPLDRSAGTALAAADIAVERLCLLVESRPQ